MHITDFIARNVPNVDDSKLPLQECQAVCAFSGKALTEGVPTSFAIKNTFNDRAYLRYPAQYVSREAYICLGVLTVNGEAGWEMRKYSFLATDNEFRILQRKDILDVMLNIHSVPFVLSFTESNKKHRSFKCTLNHSTEDFIVRTDNLDVRVDMRLVREILPTMQRWYSIVPEKRETAAAPTWFTKDDIKFGCTNNNKINYYGLEQYFTENAFLDKFRTFPIFTFLTDILTKQ